MAQYVRVLCVLLCALLSVAMVVDSRPSPLFTITDSEAAQNEQAVNTGRKLFKLVSNTLVLPYHHGPLLAGSGSEPLNVYIIWYGAFTPAQKAVITDFFASFQDSQVHPSVASWWKLTSAYKDIHNNAPPGAVTLAGQAEENYSRGRSLTQADIETLVMTTSEPASIYFLLTAEMRFPLFHFRVKWLQVAIRVGGKRRDAVPRAMCLAVCVASVWAAGGDGSGGAQR
jgi:hypothetical protein